MHDPQKMCMMCMILSPTCCAVREFQFRERMAFSVLGSLITVPLHSTLAVNNLGLKFVS